MAVPPTASSQGDAELVAITALQFLAGRTDDLARFFAISGIAPADLRRLASDIDFLGGILDFLLDDETLLLAFAAEADVAPEIVGAARRQLASGQSPLDSGQD